MPSIYIRLAGPLQSWSGRKTTGNFVQTDSVPTRSALLGLIAASQGWPRGEWESWIEDTDFKIRVDKPGVKVNDFHTVGPHVDEHEFKTRLLKAQGVKKRSLNKQARNTPDDRGGTSIISRQYLADAEFLVEVNNDKYLDVIRVGLQSPEFSLYLGRKAFPFSFPFYLGEGDEGALHSLPTVGKESSAKLELHRRSGETNLGVSKVTVPCVDSFKSWISAVKTELVR